MGGHYADDAWRMMRLLLTEDDPADAELELRELKRAGLSIEHRIVHAEEPFIAALREFLPDVIVSDFTMPQFDGMAALRLAHELAPDTPFIFVSGTLGEDYAIRALKNGATDYVLKTNLMRLPAAVERALAEAKERRGRRRAEIALGRAQVMAKLAHVTTDADGSFTGSSETLPDLIATQSGRAPRSTREWLELLHPADREPFRARSLEAAASGRRAEIDYRLRREDGEWIHVRHVMEPYRGRDAQPGEWFTTLQDVTEQKLAEERIDRLNRVYSVLSGINALIVRAASRDELFTGACRIAVQGGGFALAWIGVVDRAGRRLAPVAWHGNAEGYLQQIPLALSEQPEESVGLAARAVAIGKAMVANDLASDPRMVISEQALARGFRSLIVLPLSAGEKVVAVLTLYAEQAGFFDDKEMRLLNELAGDLSYALDHIEKAEKLDYLAYYDPLTGLANRRLLIERLTQAIAASSREQKKFALVISDIERFKTINDTLGRQAGDALLGALSARLAALATDASRVAHVGADRFAVIVPEVAAEQRLARIVEQGAAQIESEPFQVGGTELRVALRSGIALFPADGADADTLFRNAEAALKRAKSTGEKYLFYTQQMGERIAGVLALENRLRQALEKEEFVLHYQPKVDGTGRIVGAEALIRWQRDKEDLVQPAKFIALLEETGLIMQVGAWALKRASLDHRAWQERGLPAPRVAVNVSPLQLRQRDFVAVVGRAIAGGTAPTGIDLEITESLVMEDMEGNTGKLRALRELGVEIAIDDFGTGYSSLGYLAKLPVQSLKIDRSFVAKMESDPNAMNLVSTIVSLAHSLKLKVVAEGVESEAQARLLRALRCDEMQGYLFSKALPVDEFTALLKK